MPVKRFRRTRWLIDSDVQVRLSVRLALCLVGYVMLFCLIALAEPFAILLGLHVTDLTRDAAVNMLVDFSSTTLAPLLFAVACMVLHGVLILHRLAGPVFRVRKAMEALLSRDLTDRIHLRDHDYLVPLAETHNRAAERIRAEMRDVKVELEAILAGDPDEKTRQHAEAAAEILSRYRMSPDDWTPSQGVENDAILPELDEDPTPAPSDHVDRESAIEPAEEEAEESEEAEPAKEGSDPVKKLPAN